VILRPCGQLAWHWSNARINTVWRGGILFFASSQNRNAKSVSVGVESLKVAAEDLLLQFIVDVEIVESEPVQLLQFAEKFALSRLKEKLLDFITAHFDILEV
jgi:hypothetical protein